MSSSNSKNARPWLSDTDEPYDPQAPNLYDPKQFPWVKEIESQWEVIRDELVEVMEEAERNFEAYQDIEKTDKDAAWKTAGMLYWTQKSPKNIAMFPKTWSIFKDLPYLTSCSLHLLEPKATIRLHIGDTDAMYRCHMGLIVPAGLPHCGFRVGTETVAWEEGKIFIFNDAKPHTAWNNTDQNRYVISFDIMRPEYYGMRSWIASQVLGKIFVEVAYQHNKFLSKYLSGRPIRRFFSGFAKAVVRVLILVGLPLNRLI